MQSWMHVVLTWSRENSFAHKAAVMESFADFLVYYQVTQRYEVIVILLSCSNVSSSRIFQQRMEIN